MGRLRAVLFDLDGTLLDTAPDFADAVNRVRAERGLDPLPLEQVRPAVTHGARGLVERLFGVHPEAPDFEPLRRALLAHYEARLAVHTRLFSGLEEVLGELARRALPWGVVTNKPERFTRPLLDRLDFPARPAAVVCPDHVAHPKPHAEPVELACRQLGVPPGEALVVGDHLRDIEAGRAAGCPTACAAWGYLAADDAPEQWGAEYLLARPADLGRILFS
ncbi:MAG: phosphoglycolate phosphatase [Porticoccaceae bacterium]|nr:MAG: phosphoglycolate phosphatase [Porticoccaceae bacterium]